MPATIVTTRTKKVEIEKTPRSKRHLHEFLVICFTFIESLNFFIYF